MDEKRRFSIGSKILTRISCYNVYVISRAGLVTSLYFSFRLNPFY